MTKKSLARTKNRKSKTVPRMGRVKVRTARAQEIHAEIDVKTGASKAPPPVTPPARLEGDARVEAETEVLLSRNEQTGDMQSGLEQGAGSIGDLIRHMFQPDNAKYGAPGTEQTFVRDALLCAADDFQLIELALLDHNATDISHLLARFAHRAEKRAQVAVELDHRLELGLEARKEVRS